jgi:hypothetical protein
MTEIKRIMLAIVISVLFLVVWVGLFPPPLVGVWYSTFQRIVLIPCIICKRREKIGKDVGVWYIPMRHVQLEL